jgi:hypothetical protein
MVKDRDFTSIARTAVEKAIGEHLDGSPLMEAGISDHVWDISEIVALLPVPQFGPRGSYKREEE